MAPAGPKSSGFTDSKKCLSSEYTYEHLQRQLQRILGRLLERELLRWNGGTWDFLRRVVPNDMLDEALSWLDEHIPPEGIPI
ncbi:unnamed protein product [Symbiodinium necroappetens]|uniref:Uncharacterized protein n=1 Tax=Symbiodinium necroappetens TaxID=1628268 RepID=A0A812PB50_9DINO|nr:unnamed protein product [Symbiodinium necroappetens]